MLFMNTAGKHLYHTSKMAGVVEKLRQLLSTSRTDELGCINRSELSVQCIIQSVISDLLGPIPHHCLFYSYFTCKFKQRHGGGFNEFKVSTRQTNVCNKKV